MNGLPVIIEYIRSYYQQSFKPVYLMLVMAMLGILIYLNYWERDINSLVSSYAWTGRFVSYYLLFGVPFGLSWLLQKFFYRGERIFMNKWFWVFLLIAPAIFAFRVCFNFHVPFLTDFFSGDLLYFWLNCSKWPIGFFVVTIPVYLIWKIKENPPDPFYGNGSIKGLKPYFLLMS